jgi:uncharacterized protein YbjQ (UPF0145 family)
MNKIQIVTTTSSVEGWTIEKYCGVVTHQIVIGANIFRDVFASFRDILGGVARGYQRDLQNMEEIALENLKNKASKLGGNLILGLRLDFDEVSGGGKSMFMLSASGTAAFGKPGKEQTELELNELIPFERLDFEIERDLLHKRVLSESYSIQRPNEIEELIEYRVDILDKVILFMENQSAYFDESKDLLTQYLQNVSTESINKFLLSSLFLSIRKDTFYKFISLLSSTNWFSYEVIKSLLSSKNPKAHLRVLYLLEFQNNYFSKNDITELNHIVELLISTYKDYPIVQTTKGILGKEKTEWVCLNCGMKNSIELSICTKFECQANIYGIPKNQSSPVLIMQLLLIKIEKLNQLLNLSQNES